MPITVFLSVLVYHTFCKDHLPGYLVTCIDLCRVLLFVQVTLLI